MEAAAKTRQLTGERAQRIVDAMRASVAQRGAAGSTFDHVAREAGVSRGLLHYYFGTKERLLVEVVRRECEGRGELRRAAVGGWTSPPGRAGASCCGRPWPARPAPTMCSTRSCAASRTFSARGRVASSCSTSCCCW